jgi:hypothetical protein
MLALLAKAPRLRDESQDTRQGDDEYEFDPCDSEERHWHD